ncbi:cytochrome P450 [Ramicandelaber brevisporus]|nr:cytochrome P450 [Ramicandelaber brevisporus]
MPGTLLAQLVDHNIVVSKTHDWRRHRRVVNPAFKRGWNPDVFGECAKSAAERISNTPGMVLNVHPCITAITVDSLTKTAFGQSLGALDGKSVKFVELFQEVLREMFSILPTVMPWLDRPWNPFRRHLHAKVAEIDATFAEIVAVKRNELKRRVLDEKEEIGGSQMDILSLLINACESESAGWPLSVSELAADVRMFYQAGSETTAASITCMLYLLAKNPEIQTKARQHVIDIMGDDAACPIPTAEQVRQLTYLTQVIKETLRVYPSIVFSPPRRTTREVELAGHIIPTNTRVAVSTWLVHRNVRHWQYPERFDPDRFSDETNDSISSKNRGWVPFGAGPRACIGMSMSMMEQKVVMSVLLRKFTWTLPPDAPSALKFDPSLMLSPNNCRLQFAHRH